MMSSAHKRLPHAEATKLGPRAPSDGLSRQLRVACTRRLRPVGRAGNGIWERCRPLGGRCHINRARVFRSGAWKPSKDYRACAAMMLKPDNFVPEPAARRAAYKPVTASALARRRLMPGAAGPSRQIKAVQSASGHQAPAPCVHCDPSRAGVCQQQAERRRVGIKCNGSIARRLASERFFRTTRLCGNTCSRCLYHCHPDKASRG